MLNRNKRPLYRLAAVILIMSLLACSSALAAADYFARYKYAFSPEALVAASAAVPPEGMNETAMDIYRLGYAAGFDQALGNNVVFTNDKTYCRVSRSSDVGVKSTTMSNDRLVSDSFLSCFIRPQKL